MDHEDKPYLYNLSQCFICCSFYEGFGFPGLESLACNKPVITSYSGSLSEVLTKIDNVYFVDPYDIEKIAYLLDYVIKNHGLSISKSIDFTWQKAANELKELFSFV